MLWVTFLKQENLFTGKYPVDLHISRFIVDKFFFEQVLPARTVELFSRALPGYVTAMGSRHTDWVAESTFI